MKQTKGQQRPKYRLSPNEVEQLKKEETERRRKLRIVQVREQSKAAAAKIRSDVKNERKRQLVKLAKEIEGQLEDEKQEEVKRLEQRYDNTLRTIGQGHTQAKITDKNTSHAERRVVELENKQRAEDRHKEALRKVALDKAYKEYEETSHFRDRQAALLTEKGRAAEVASRPPPPPDQISNILTEYAKKYRKPIPMTDMNAFSTTHYHIPDFAVEKAPLEQQHDGRAAGDEEDERTKEEISERRKREHDQLVRARIRGNEALKMEKLKHEYNDLMADLSLQQRADRRRRQVVVSKLPKQVFLPADRRMEELDDKQMEMERAFENMYMKQMNLSGDLSLTLDPNPMPSTPVEGKDDWEGEAEDSALVIPTMPAVNPALRELTNLSRLQSQAGDQGKPENALKKLLNKIKEQRSEVEAEKTQVEDSGRENSGLKFNKKEAASKGHSFSSARQPVSKPAADPDLELSPMKAPGNQKPQKSPSMVGKEKAMNEDDGPEITDDTEEGFLDGLKDRLQAIEAQKNYLDMKMKERHENIQQFQQPQQQQPLPSYDQFSARPSAGPHGSTTIFSSSGGPTQASQVPVTQFFPTQSVSMTTLSGTDLWKTTAYGGNILPQPQNVSQNNDAQPQTLRGNTLSAETNYFRQQPASELQSRLGVSQASIEMSVSSGYPGLSQPLSGPLPSQALQPPGTWSGVVGGGLPSTFNGVGAPSQAALYQGRGLNEAAASSEQNGSRYPFSSHIGSAPVTGSVPSGLTSVPAFGSVSRTDTYNAPTAVYATSASVFSSAQTHPATGIQPSALTLTGSQPSATNGTAYRTSFTHTSSTGMGLADAGDHLGSLFPSASLTQSQPLQSSGPATAAGPSEEERVQRLREFQRQLIEKHQERMSSLQDVRARIETRQTQSNSLSLSQRVTDPASLVPYTLKTTALQPQPSGGGSGPAFSMLPAATGVPQSSFSGFGVRVPFSAESSAPLLASIATTEPILAGSAGITMATSALDQQRLRPQGVSSQGVEPTSSLSKGRQVGKKDSVRKSLPFDDLDDSLQGGEQDVVEVSAADDSHISSSTDRGSPALGCRSNKSSMSGRSGLLAGSASASGGSGSGGSLGGSSLVARAEEKRVSFEQRQKELQDQLKEIQRQKDALLQRYHGNQKQVSTQEEELRRKLKIAQAATAPTSAKSVELSAAPASAMSLGVRQSSSPSSEVQQDSLSTHHLSKARELAAELEEGSLSSEQASKGQSWAAELEEYSLPDKSGAQRSSYLQTPPGSMTLEEFSITSDWSGGKGAGGGSMGKGTTEEKTRPLSSLSSLEEYSIVSGNGDKLGPLGRDAVKSQEGPSGMPGFWAEETGVDRDPDSARGRLDIQDLLQDLGGGTAWPDAVGLPISSTTDYQPHELSTILEVDTPQTDAKQPGSALPRAGEDKSSARRYIEFGRHGSLPEEDRESKFSASGSSATSDVRSVIEVRQPTVGLGLRLGGEGSQTLRGEETLFRDNVPESSTMKEPAWDRVLPAPASRPSKSAESSGSVFQSLELTSDSLTEDSSSQAHHNLDSIGGSEGAGGRNGGGKADDILRQARLFNQDLMAAIQRQSSDVFDQSSLSSLSHTATESSLASHH